MRTSIVDIHELTFDYPGFRALDHLSLRIEAGTVTALVGPNGAGKTTLLRCIAALETPVSGSIRVAGHNVFETPRKVHRVMGYVSDNFGLYSDLTVAQGLQFAAHAKGLEAHLVPKAVQSIATQMGLLEKLEKLAHTLSRGQRQRLAIGQAIIHSPQILLLDEPASGLDPEARASIADVFKSLQARGMTLLVSSHILAELDAYSTHMLSINDGRILEYRALGLGSTDVQGGAIGRVLRLEFVSGAQDAATWLAGQTHVRPRLTVGQVVDIEFTAGPLEQAALVAGCVSAGYALTSIVQVNENLQDSYLKSLQAQRSTDAQRKANP